MSIFKFFVKSFPFNFSHCITNIIYNTACYINICSCSQIYRFCTMCIHTFSHFSFPIQQEKFYKNDDDAHNIKKSQIYDCALFFKKYKSCYRAYIVLFASDMFVCVSCLSFYTILFKFKTFSYIVFPSLSDTVTTLTSIVARRNLLFGVCIIGSYMQLVKEGTFLLFCFGKPMIDRWKTFFFG